MLFFLLLAFLVFFLLHSFFALQFLLRRFILHAEAFGESSSILSACLIDLISLLALRQFASRFSFNKHEAREIERKQAWDARRAQSHAYNIFSIDHGTCATMAFWASIILLIPTSACLVAVATGTLSAIVTSVLFFT